MQHGPRRKVIFAYRGVGKTWIYAAYVCWRLLNNPNAKIMVVSGSSNYAADFTRFVKRLIVNRRANSTPDRRPILTPLSS